MGGRARRWTDDQLRVAVPLSRSVHEVFRRLGLRVGGGQHGTIKRRIRELGLDTSHFTDRGCSSGSTTSAASGSITAWRTRRPGAARGWT